MSPRLDIGRIGLIDTVVPCSRSLKTVKYRLGKRRVDVGNCIIHLLPLYDSLCRIKDIGDIVIANHDSAYENVSQIP